MSGDRKLKWGQTPWDDLGRDELLREVQRMASALQSANSVLRMTRSADPEHLYWVRGTGAYALAKIDQALARLAEYDSESVYRSFYRYADDLLFERVSGIQIGFGWAVCPVCGQMFGEQTDGTSNIGVRCGSKLNQDCPGILRPIEWDDLKS